MAGAVGGGGLGDIAVRYGYYRYQTDIMLVTVALLIVIVQVFQSVGMFVANRPPQKIMCNICGYRNVHTGTCLYIK